MNQLISIFILIILISCAKDSDTTDKNSLLIRKAWKETAFTVNPAFFNPEMQTSTTDLFFHPHF
jgi:hypothetical protein